MSGAPEDFNYALPKARIAQSPRIPRDQARLLRLGRATGAISHHRFVDLIDLLPPEAVLVMNQTRVEPRRLFARKLPAGGRVELLLLDDEGENRWTCMVKPGIPVGQVLSLLDQHDQVTKTRAEVEVVKADGTRVIAFADDPKRLWNQLGSLPVPPYIKNYEGDPEFYQTVYAEALGSMAAPTAGLHFTPELLDQLRARGVQTEYITLHVSRDTAFPVPRDEPLDSITIHGELAGITLDVAARINLAKAAGRPIIAVGTTTVRTLEGSAASSGTSLVSPLATTVNLFIKPGHPFRVIDGMITNFHVPRSTLMLLVSAFAGRENLLAAYEVALAEEYRFLSFGDAMLIC